MINADPLKNGTLQKKKYGTVWYGQDDKFGRTTVYKELKIWGRYRIQKSSFKSKIDGHQLCY